MNDESNTTGQFICAKCGKFVYCLIDNLCQDCYNNLANRAFPFTYPENHSLNYKCPDCKANSINLLMETGTVLH